jgi:hypothetical protein
MEQRLLSVERRLEALLRALPDSMKEKVEAEKRKMMEETGEDFLCYYEMETDKGTKDIEFTVRAWSSAQALYIGWEETIYPNIKRLQDESKIRWFKRNKMEVK